MPWDASPCLEKYLQLLATPANGNEPNFAAALQALDDAITRSPRSIDLLRQRVLLKQKLSQPVASDIGAILSLDRANARIRMNLALPDTDLPAKERIAILQQAPRFRFATSGG